MSTEKSFNSLITNLKHFWKELKPWKPKLMNMVSNIAERFKKQKNTPEEKLRSAHRRIASEVETVTLRIPDGQKQHLVTQNSGSKKKKGVTFSDTGTVLSVKRYDKSDNSVDMDTNYKLQYREEAEAARIFRSMEVRERSGTITPEERNLLDAARELGENTQRATGGSNIMRSEEEYSRGYKSARAREADAVFSAHTTSRNTIRGYGKPTEDKRKVVKL